MTTFVICRKADHILNNANGDGNLDYLSLMVEVATLSVVVIIVLY